MTTANKNYDLIVVPGLKLGPRWGLPHDLRTRLQIAAKVYSDNPGAHIVVCGRWSIWYDWLGVTPPITECQRAKSYLVNLGVRSKDITMESRSKDTPGSVYYLKRYMRTKPQFKNLLVICAEQHKKRLQFLFYKFFGVDYRINYLPVVAPRFSKNTTGDEAVCLEEQKALLANVRAGHEEDFRHKFYKCSYYTRQASHVRGYALSLK